MRQTPEPTMQQTRGPTNRQTPEPTNRQTPEPTNRQTAAGRARVEGYFIAASWIRLPQVSSRTAVTTGP
ncbi:hypothetical protein Ait01nite_039790 [Actinoplanes italicus]|nr:hypothetical protein Ait01nite_039790 [Actinoplanes italicus]